MAKAKATKNSADIGFEKQLWDAADVLRGNMDAADYKNVVLGLIFLKYLSDRFDERYQELVAEGYGDEEDRDCYIEENVFYVPEEARWAQIASEAHTPEIGQVIDNAMRAIERENDALKDVLPKKLCAPRARQATLGRSRRPVHQHSDVRRRKRERSPRSRLRVLPLPVRITRR